MKFPEPIPVKDLAALVDGKIIGDPIRKVHGLNEINRVVKGDITFCDVKKYFSKAFRSQAACVLVNESVEAPEGKTLLFCSDPFDAFNVLIRKFRPAGVLSGVIDESAVVHPSAVVEPNAVIGPHVIVGPYAHIRANVVIHAYTTIGAHVTIHSGTVIGTDAFYYKRRPDHYDKLRSGGRVIIGDHVEIGACCTIDRGVTCDTIIGEGTKIDNQVHVGHGVVIGRNCLIAAQVGIAGKCILEDNVKLWGQVGVATRLRIGEGAQVYAQSGVSRDLKGGKAYFGSPAIEATEWFSDYRAMKRAPREIQDIRKELDS